MSQSTARRLAIWTALFLIPTAPGWAQDTHYWNQRYGTQAELLAGAVVGSPVGLSNAFYNPGGLVLTSKPQRFTTALQMEYNTLSYRPDRSKDSSLSWSSFGTAPALLAGAFGRDTTRGRIYTYSYLTRQSLDLEITGRAIGLFDGLTSAPGDEALSGQVNYRQKAKESWAGFTTARRLSSGWGLGVSLYGAYRSQRTRNEFTAAAVADSGQGATAVAITDNRFWTVRTLAKLGAMWDHGRWKAGVTFTSPSIHLFGDGNSYTHKSVTGLDLDSNGTEDSRLLADYQAQLSPTYKSPMSAAVGLSYHLTRTSLYASGEWFDKVNLYTVMEGTPVLSQVPGDTQQAVLEHEAVSVVNWALGARHQLSTKTALYAGWAIDRSAFKGDQVKSASFSNWNIYHVSLGSEFTFAAIEFTLGATYSFGDNLLEARPELDPNGAEQSLEGNLTQGDARYRRIRVLLGFTVPIR